MDSHKPEVRWALLSPAQGRQRPRGGLGSSREHTSPFCPPTTQNSSTVDPSNWSWGQHIRDAQRMWLKVFTDYKTRSHLSSPKTLMSTMQGMKAFWTCLLVCLPM